MAGEELDQQLAELPEGWKVVRLGDMISLRGGLSYKGEFLSDSGNSLVTMGCVSASERFKKSGLKRYSGDFTERHRLRVGDMVIATRDVTQNRELLGSPALVPEGLPGEAVIAATNLYMVANHSESPTEFLYWLMKTPAYRNQIVASAKGTTIVMLTKDSVENFTFPLPPLAEQKAIAAVLGALDDKIELNRRMNATLEAMARALFQSWFVDFDPVRAKLDGLKPTGLDAATSALFPAGFQTSDAGQIPTGWRKTTVGEEVDFFTGFAFQSEAFSSSSNSVRLARGDNVKEGFFHWDSKSRFWPSITPELERYRLNHGDVLIGMDGSKVGKNWVRVRNCDLPCLLVQRVARLRAKQSIGEHFIWLLVSDRRFRLHVDGVKTGTSIPHISGGQIKDYDFVRPARGDDRLFHRFEELVSPLGEQMDFNIEQSRTLATLRDSLLPKLLSGELSVADTLSKSL